MTDSSSVAASYRKAYPQTNKAVGEARRAVVEFAKTSGFFGQCLDDIEIAVGEALANAVEHGYRDLGGFEVTVRRDGRALTVEVKDNGRGFDHWSAGEHVCPSSGSLRGFGTFIMRELMDAVEYSDRGTRLRLTKRLPLSASDQRSALRA